MSKTVAENENVRSEPLLFVKGISVSIILSLALVLLFAFCLKWFDLPNACIVPVNMLIKAVCVVIGALLFVKKEMQKGLVKGSSFGLFYTILAFVVFSILSGTFDFNFTTILDVIFASVIGGFVGIFKVNKK